jgi:hypothetical protein
MTKLSTIVCAAIAAALSVRGGAIVYNNTGAAGTSDDPISSFGPLYDSFSTGSNSGPLSLLDLFVGATDPTDGDVITIALYADSSTTPGSLLASLGTISDSTLSTVPAVIAVSLTSNPVLASGTRYWIGLSSNGTGVFQYSTDTSGTGVSTEFFKNSNGVFPNTDGAYQMEVALGSSAPEPSVFALTIAGLGMLLAVAYRKKVSVR